MTRVKICGITDCDDAMVTVEAGADMLGFIFYPPSPRSVTPARARRVIEQVHRASRTIWTVGVFVDEEPDVVRRTVDACGLDGVQLHGKEPPEMVETFMDEGLRVLKAFRVRNSGSLTAMDQYHPTAFLLDAYVPDRHGGTGRTFNWSLAVKAKIHRPVLLAGGLNPDNVAEAVRAVHPWGVDTASGVEASPGLKDHDKVRQFIAAAKEERTGED